MELNITTIVAFCSLVVAAVALMANLFRSSKKESKEDAKETQDVQVRLAILEERGNNELVLLKKLEDKLDEIEDKL